MFKKFIWLEWKQFVRSSSFGKSLALKILMGVGVFFLLLYAIGAGSFLYFGLKESFPKKDPWLLVNNYIIFWFLGELIMRYAVQKMPVLTIKPLLTLPIAKKSIIHYGLTKTILSVFNFILFLVLLPFSVILIVKEYPALPVLIWFFSMILFSYTLNFVTFLVNKNNYYFATVLVFLTALVSLEYFQTFKISVIAGQFFNLFTHNVTLFIIPLITVLATYFLSYKHLEKNLKLDDLEEQKKDVKTVDLSWINRFGAVAPFLKNDLKLIWRNVRPRKTVFSALIFLFYALYFIKLRNGINSNPIMLVFAMTFVTGGFAMTFGQFVPSWDSQYYKLLMSQNIRYKTYLDSKWYLMGFAVLVSFILATPYILLGWHVYALLVAGAFFNLGINSFLVLLGGVLNRTPLKLNEKAKAFGNTQGFKITNFLIAIPKIALPIVMFAIPNAFWGFNAGIITVVGFSLIGILLKNYFLTQIEKIYQKTKYKTIKAFSENN